MALFIVFEGGDGSGKSVQSRALFRRLRQQGYPALLTREPGGSALGENLRRWLKRSQGLSPLTELSLFTAARSQLVAEVVRPTLQSGTMVICDRFTASTVAYQGYGRGLDLKLVQRLNRLASDGLAPDLTVLLDLPLRALCLVKTSAPILLTQRRWSFTVGYAKAIWPRRRRTPAGGWCWTPPGPAGSWPRTSGQKFSPSFEGGAGARQNLVPAILKLVVGGGRF